MKAGWESKKLGEACQIARGGSPRPIQDYITNDSDGVNWVKISDATASGKFIYVTKEKIKPSGVARSRLVKPGDFLLSNSMSFGRPYIMQTSGCIHDGWLVLSDYEKCFDQSFLYHLLGSPVVFDQFDRLAAGSTVRNLNIELASRVELPVPPLAEQHRIVALLDEASDGIATAKANAEKNLQNARALFESHLQSVFTQIGKDWSYKPLADVCDLQNGYAFKSSDYIQASNTLNIRMSAIRPSGIFDPEHNQRFLPDSYAQTYSTFLLNEGDLVIAMTDMAGDPKILGVPTLVENLNGRSFLMNQRVGKLRDFSEEVFVPYLRYFLSSPLIKRYYKELGAGGLQINISKGDILSAKIPLPPIAEQKKVVSLLTELSDRTQHLEAIYEQKLTALDELKKSLLNQAFSGKL